MPVVNRQKPSPARAAPSPNGSLLSQATPVADLEDDYLKFVIYGQNRVGKTTLACQFPKPLLLLAMEPNKTGGALSVRKVPDVWYKHLDDTTSFVRLASELRAGSKFKTVVVDSATSLQDIVLKELMGLSAVPEQLNWGLVSRDQYRERSEKTRECLRPYIDLPMHVVVLAKEKDHNPPDRDRPEILRHQAAESFFAADLGGATVGWLHDACDYVTRLYMEKETVERSVTVSGKTTVRLEETGKNVRRLRCMYHPNFAAGIRSDNPQMVPEWIQDPTYEKIRRVVAGEKL